MRIFIKHLFTPTTRPRLMRALYAILFFSPLATRALERPAVGLVPETTSINEVRDFYEVICVATSWILVFGIIIGVLFIVWGGVKYITSGGESSKEEDAKGVIKTALIGVVFLILAVALVRIVVSFFGGNISLDLINCRA